MSVVRAAVLALVLVAPAAAASFPVPEPGAWGVDDFALTEYFEAEEMAAWRDFRNAHRRISLIELPLAIAFFLAFLVGPLGPSLKRSATRVASRIGSRLPGGRVASAMARVFGEDWGTSILFAYAYMLLGMATTVPFALWRESLDREAGLSNQTDFSWLYDFAKGQLMMVVIFSFLVLGLFGLIRRFPRRWWLVLGVPAGLMLFGYGVVAPYRARVFHEFRPLENAALEARLRALADAEGLTFESIKVVNASRITNALNAYVTGVGPSRELVLFDTLLAAMPHDEIAFAVAHELGHHRRRDILVRYALSAVATVALMALFAWALVRLSPRLKFDGPADIRNLPLLLFLTMLVFLAIRPAHLAYSRYEERLADRVAFELTGDAEAFISQQVRLARVNRADVDPPGWVTMWFGSHPSIRERIGTARWYRRWLAETQGTR